jgi:DUF971 family protein
MQAPVGLHNDIAQRMLEVAWPDGTRQRLTHASLRAQCRCADCSSRRRRGSAEPAVSSQLTIINIRPVGAYAVQLVFSDGHQRGIFPWDFLRGLDGDMPLPPQ